MKYKVLFCGTPEFAKIQLESLLADSDYEIQLVVSQPDRPSGRGHKLKPSPVKELAVSKNIPVLTPEKASDPLFIEQLQKYTFDICVVVAYGQILRKNFLDLFPQKCVNLHASLLPRWRGAAPIQRAIMEGDAVTGICLQVVVAKLDAGDVIGERSISLTEEMNAVDLHNSLAKLGTHLLSKDLKEFLQNQSTPQKQDESLVTYAHKIEKQESDIDWSQSAERLHNKIRGLAMGPQASTTFQGRRLKILKTKRTPLQGTPATILRASQDELVVACGTESLQILVVQPESKKPMVVSEFLKGYKLEEGESLVTS
jgi:methionyl-tRNA formyltransferase